MPRPPATPLAPVPVQASAPRGSGSGRNRGAARSAVLLLATALHMAAGCGGDSDVIHIGVSLPLSGDLEAPGRAMLRGVEMLVDNVNADGGIDGQPVRIVAIDDGNTPEGAAAAATRFADDERIVGVVGHFYSSTALGATRTYDDRGLVNIVPVANDPRVTRESPWVFGMLPPTDVEGRFMATYLSRILGIDRAAVIHETEAYGRGLAEAFLAEADRLGIEIVAVDAFDPSLASPSTLVRQLTDVTAHAILVFSQVDVGRRILHQIHLSGLHAPVLVPSAFVEDPSLPAFTREFDVPLYAVSPFLYQTANSQATRFQQEYVERYGHEPGTGAPMAYDAARLLLTAAKEAGPDRTAVRDYLGELRDPRAIHSVTGVLAMDGGGAVDRALYLTHVDEGHFKVAFTQLLPDGGGGLRPVEVVHVGVDHFRVETIDPSSFNFKLELFLWVKWQGEGLDTSEIIIINGLHGIDDERYVLVEDLSGSVNYRAYRMKSTYLTPFDLREFPFDRQTLELQVGHRTRESTELLLVPDVGHFRSEPVRLYDPEWRDLGRRVYSELYRYPSHFGNPGVQERDDAPYFSSVNVELGVARMALPHLLTALLPLVLILVLTVAVLWLSRVEFAVRLGIGMTSLLAILVFHMTQAASLPNIGYLTKIDLYFVTSYVWIFILFVTMIGVYALRQQGFERSALTLNRIGPPFVLLSAFATFAWITWGW